MLKEYMRVFYGVFKLKLYSTPAFKLNRTLGSCNHRTVTWHIVFLPTFIDGIHTMKEALILLISHQGPTRAQTLNAEFHTRYFTMAVGRNDIGGLIIEMVCYCKETCSLKDFSKTIPCFEFIFTKTSFSCFGAPKELVPLLEGILRVYLLHEVNLANVARKVVADI